jgi:hypothetical protein
MNVLKEIKSPKFLLSISIIGLSGCASFGIDGELFNSRILSANQRMLLVTDEAELLDSNGIKTKNHRAVCSEPSPDAMKALSFAENLNVSLESKLTVGETFALGQTLGELGERNTTIQSVRDIFYNDCIAYLNGEISPSDYKEFRNLIDIYSLTLLSIDNLTKTISRPATIIASQASFKSGTDNKPEVIAGNQNPSVIGNNSSISATDKKEMAQEIRSLLKEYYNEKLRVSAFSLIDKIPNLLEREVIKNNPVMKTTLEKTYAQLIQNLIELLNSTPEQIHEVINKQANQVVKK